VPAPSQEEPKPEEDPEIIVIEAADDDVPLPPMGWTVRIYHKTGGDSVSHRRLVGMLAAYFAD
jgi:hypothetical protein